ncbi:MAG: hypothetical protein ACR2NB_01555 [Solirubrobacteraceae bacterium]
MSCEPRSQSAAAAGIVVVWIIHSATDWDWQLAAVTLPAIAAIAVTLAPRRVRTAAS